MIMRIVLTGMMGAGKSVAGKILAARLAVPFFDADERIAAEVGRSVAELIRREGEAAFRKREAAALGALVREEAGVIAAGGGAVLAEENRLALSEWGTVVYLRAAPEILAARLGDAAPAERPLLAGGDPEGTIRRLLTERALLYEEANLVVDTDRLTPEETAAAVLRALSN